MMLDCTKRKKNIKYNMFICNGLNMLNGRTMSTNKKKRKRYSYTMKCNKDQM